MSKAFFHESIGYWETTSEPSQDILNNYPEGYEVVPFRPNDGYEYELVKGKWVKGELIQKIPRTKGTAREFMALFTTEEKMNIVNLTMTDPAIKLWYDEALAGEVWLDYPDVALGLNAMKQAGVITAERVDEILATDFNA